MFTWFSGSKPVSLSNFIVSSVSLRAFVLREPLKIHFGGQANLFYSGLRQKSKTFYLTLKTIIRVTLLLFLEHFYSEGLRPRASVLASYDILRPIYIATKQTRSPLKFLFVLALHWGGSGGILLWIWNNLGYFEMEILLDAGQIKAALSEIAGRIVNATPAGTRIAVIGIKSRGEILAERLCRLLSDKLGREIPCGELDITLYRDDINDPHGKGQPTVRSTKIDFDIDDMIIILVDDVLATGRSTRAAMDALIDFGRPKAIRLAVLVERGDRELPIQSDYSGCKADVSPDKSVEVNLFESDGIDQVVVSKA